MRPKTLTTVLATWLVLTPWAHAEDAPDCRPLEALGAALADRSKAFAATMQATSCQWVDVPGGPSQIHCRWSFDYRDPEALARYDNLITDVEHCFPATRRQPREAGVNHPDVYLLTEFRGPAQRIHVSLKDKIGLGKTFVFLRMAPE